MMVERKPVGKISVAHEDYLEAIIMLGGTTEQPVRSVDIAARLGVSKASVSKAISTLKEEGLVVQPYYGDITLTEEGERYGLKVEKRHRLLFTFFTQVLGIDPDTADAEACALEHGISDDSFEKWCAYIESLDLRPVRCSSCECKLPVL